MSTRLPPSKTLLRLYRLVLPYRRTILLGLACLVLAIAAELTPPLIWKNVVDVGVAERDWNYILRQLLLLVAVFMAAQLLQAIRGVLLERAGQRLVYDLRVELYNTLQQQSASYFARHRTGDLLARLTSDVESVEEVLIRGTDSVIANFLRVVGVAAIFIALHPPLGLLVLTPMVGVALLLRRYNRQVRPFYRAARTALGDLSAKLADALGGMRIIQLFAQEGRERQLVARFAGRLYEQQVAAVVARNRVFPVVRWVAQMGNVLMLGGGTWFILQGTFTVGGLLAYRGYNRYFHRPIDDLVNINDMLLRAAAAGQRLFEVLDAPQLIEDAPGAEPLPAPLEGLVELRDVTFAYENGPPVLEEVSLRVEPGERVVILGPSGAGKSTILSLIARFYDPDTGQVCVDGRDLRGVSLASLRSQLAQVEQDPFLFNASVRENIAYARPNATQAEIEAAARAANAHEFIRDFPEGDDTLVGERGVRLSGGQKQRLAIARALLADPRLLLLDEPTSAVEPASEALILGALDELMEGRTTILVTHRLSLALAANRVLIVDEHRIVEEGPPHELLQRESRFATMLREDESAVVKVGV